MRTTSEIEALAEDILVENLGELSSITLPVDLSKIAEGSGVTVRVGKFDDPDIAGVYSKADRVIYVSDENYPRFSFTLAHELGHFFLHEDKEEEVFLRQNTLDPGAQRDELEVEANKFAAALLMPSDLVQLHWNIRPSVSDVATTFGVSRSAATWRLVNLGLLES